MDQDADPELVRVRRCLLRRRRGRDRTILGRLEGSSCFRFLFSFADSVFELGCDEIELRHDGELELQTCFAVRECSSYTKRCNN